MNRPTAPLRRRFGPGAWVLIFALFFLLGLAVHFLVAGWSAAGDASTEISAAGYVAMVLGVLVTLALGVGLMALVFYGNRRR